MNISLHGLLLGSSLYSSVWMVNTRSSEANTLSVSSIQFKNHFKPFIFANSYNTVFVARSKFEKGLDSSISMSAHICDRILDRTIHHGVVSISESYFYNISTDKTGGALYINGDLYELSLLNCVFHSCYAKGEEKIRLRPSASGGAVLFNGHTLVVNRVVFHACGCSKSAPCIYAYTDVNGYQNLSQFSASFSTLGDGCTTNDKGRIFISLYNTTHNRVRSNPISACSIGTTMTHLSYVTAFNNTGFNSMWIHTDGSMATLRFCNLVSIAVTNSIVYINGRITFYDCVFKDIQHSMFADRLGSSTVFFENCYTNGQYTTVGLVFSEGFSTNDIYIELDLNINTCLFTVGKTIRNICNGAILFMSFLLF